ncbi:MAG TPA: type I methionyl aminopeptidase [Frankiaceae bacterium]|jgi:methionyl aminopeptidase|nr:type I methionyl aminopeptidase [Frankiaceae bacterium]
MTTTTLAANDLCWCGSGRRYKRCHRLADLDPAAAAAKAAAAEPVRRVKPGRLSPPREVPAHIPRPDYAVTGTPVRTRASGKPKTPDEIERMRRAGRAAAEVLQVVGAAVRPGITTDELDAIAHEECLKRGGYPSPLNYNGFPKSLCTSVNEVICHGIPDSSVLDDGDIVNLDVTIFLDGVHGDTNATFLVGDVDEESRRLVRVTKECLDRGIAVVRPGAQVRDIGRAIQDHAEANGFGVVRAFVGHGIGTTFHADPQIPHYYDPRATTRLEAGMTFTIEPMITAGSWEHRMWDDDWTAVTADLKRTAQFEHTLLVTDDGAEILTCC